MKTTKSLSETCYLCGDKIEVPEKEHFLPQALMKSTGDLNRKINMPIGLGATQNIEFAKVYLMVCADCHRKLNVSIDRPGIDVLLKLISSKPIDSMSIQTLLNLLDKIRCGFWFYQHIYLTNNGSKDWLHSIWPFFNRIEKFDRGLIIQKISQNQSKGLTIFGINTPIFLESPNCFSLIINDWVFISYSSPFAFSKLLNLPRPKRLSLYKPKYDGIEIISSSDIPPGKISKEVSLFPDVPNGFHIISPKQNGLSLKNAGFKQIFTGMTSNDPETFDFIHEPKIIINDKVGYRRIFNESLDISRSIEVFQEFEFKSHILLVSEIQRILFTIYNDVAARVRLQGNFIDKLKQMDFPESET